MTSVRPADDAAPADWLIGSGAAWWDLVRFGPPGFAAYVRIAFPTDSDRPGSGPEETVLPAALGVLTRHTSTPSDAFAAIWEGWTSSVSPPEAPRVSIPNRPMRLFAGSVDDLRNAPAVAWYGDARRPGPAPHLLWPEDRAWCLAWEVDEELEFTVGCSVAAAEDLARALPGGVRRVGYGHRVPLWADDC